MSRLLFAAARGARIQSQYHNWSNGGHDWREANLNQLYDDSRIHPDDEHLQYGPFSTAIRLCAETDNIQEAHLPYFTGNFALTSMEWDMLAASIGGFDRAFFFLMVAEALADEGL